MGIKTGATSSGIRASGLRFDHTIAMDRLGGFMRERNPFAPSLESKVRIASRINGLEPWQMSGGHDKKSDV